MIRIFPCVLPTGIEEMHGSPEEVISSEPGEIGVSRVFKCRWEDRVAVACAFLGWWIARGSNIEIHEPHRYTEISWHLIAVSVSLGPSGKISARAGDSRFASYPTCYLTIKYAMPRLEYVTEGYGNLVKITETVQGASEFLTLPTGNLYWGKGAGKKPLENLDAPGKICNMTELVINISNASSYPEEVLDCPGKINKYPIDLTSRHPSLYWPATTVLYENPTITREFSLGQEAGTFSITLRFMHKDNGIIGQPKGWNYFPDLSEPGIEVNWAKVTDGTNEKNIYKEADYRKILI